jgi:hypothetical protein
MAIWNILRPFGEFSDHLVNFVLIWYIFSRFGITHQQKSGNPDTYVCIYGMAIDDFVDMKHISRVVQPYRRCWYEQMRETRECLLGTGSTKLF